MAEAAKSSTLAVSEWTVLSRDGTVHPNLPDGVVRARILDGVFRAEDEVFSEGRWLKLADAPEFRHLFAQSQPRAVGDDDAEASAALDALEMKTGGQPTSDRPRSGIFPARDREFYADQHAVASPQFPAPARVPTEGATRGVSSDAPTLEPPPLPGAQSTTFQSAPPPGVASESQMYRTLRGPTPVRSYDSSGATPLPTADRGSYSSPSLLEAARSAARVSAAEAAVDEARRERLRGEPTLHEPVVAPVAAAPVASAVPTAAVAPVTTPFQPLDAAAVRELQRGQRFSNSSVWFWGLAISALVIGSALWLRDKFVKLSPTQQRAANLAERANVARKQGGEAAYAEAETLLNKAQALNEAVAADETRVALELSSIHAAWAQSIRDASALRAQNARAEARVGDEQASADVASARADREARYHVQKAREFAEQALKNNANSDPAKLAMVDVLRLEGKTDEAKAAYDAIAARQKDTPSLDALRVGSLLLSQSGANADQEKALELAKQAADNSEASVEDQLRAARIALRAGKPDEALSYTERAEKLAPEDPALGDLRAALTAPKPGKRGARRSAKLAAVDHGEPTDAELAKLAANQRAAKRAETAEATAKTAAEPEATRSAERRVAKQAGAQRGSRLAPGERGQPKELFAAPETVSEERALHLGAFWVSHGQPARARTYFERALELNPRNAQAITGYGYVVMNEGRTDAAARLFERAVSLGDSEAWIGLGLVHERQGNTSAAVQAFESYLSNSPSGPSRTIAEDKVDRLKQNT